ncbi:Arc family DNA-binding protein [Rosenbergiella epipactidis]|uniref:Arc family DNA-binding protein n=1 Tax=Rosenbergiella epipactidis TaxID=1544694 RepID=UPI001F4DDDD7|nr:Arc family DNA-binding protein [Rosenbergiella epipactidis]
MKGMRNIAPFGLRMPDEIRDAITERAKSNGRSINSEIIQILQEALEGKELPPSEHKEAPLDIDDSKVEFYSLPREEQIRQIGEFDPLQAEIEKISDYYSEKMKDDVFSVIKRFTKKPE